MFGGYEGEKEKKKKRGEENRRGRERKRIEREKKWGEKKREFFPAFRRSNLDGLRVKVNPRNEGYAWVPKSGSFAKLQEVEKFSTWINF